MDKKEEFRVIAHYNKIEDLQIWHKNKKIFDTQEEAQKALNNYIEKISIKNIKQIKNGVATYKSNKEYYEFTGATIEKRSVTDWKKEN